ncbi:MAG: Gfo/Idh/MocA family protein [Thermoanaerobaculia bacterium]
MARVRVGIIGTGWGARVQVPAFRSAGLHVTAIAGSNPEKTRRVAAEHDLMAFDDWKDLVASPEFGLVSIVTPPSEHLQMALAALEAGKHVLSEKPTARNVQEAEWMTSAAARRPGQLALIDHELRFLPSWRAARAMRGELGALRYVEVRYASPSRADPSRPWTWWSDAEKGGGVWGAAGSHYVDALRYFAGEITAVQGLLHTFIRERPEGEGMRRVTSDDFAAAHVRLEGDALADMVFSVVAARDEETTMTFHGTHAGMRLAAEDLWWCAPGAEWTRRVAGESLQVPGNSPGGPFGSGTVYFARALHAALVEGDRSALAPAATFADGLAQQRVLDTVRRSSAAGGRWEDVR